MVHIEDGGSAKKVPLVYYDEEGNRHVVGNADAQIVNGELQVTGHLESNRVGMEMGEMHIEAFSIDELKPSTGALYSRNDHVTKTNPTGSVQQCDKRHIHAAHEWQNEFGGYFNVYCPGNDGTRE